LAWGWPCSSSGAASIRSSKLRPRRSTARRLRIGDHHVQHRDHRHQSPGVHARGDCHGRPRRPAAHHAGGCAATSAGRTCCWSGVCRRARGPARPRVHPLLASAAYARPLAPVDVGVIAEIFPNRVRAPPCRWPVSALWIACFILTFAFPLLQRTAGIAATFWIYAAICLAGFFFVRAKVPETKGRKPRAESSRTSIVERLRNLGSRRARSVGIPPGPFGPGADLLRVQRMRPVDPLIAARVLVNMPAKRTALPIAASY